MKFFAQTEPPRARHGAMFALSLLGALWTAPAPAQTNATVGLVSFNAAIRFGQDGLVQEGDFFRFQVRHTGTMPAFQMRILSPASDSAECSDFENGRITSAAGLSPEGWTNLCTSLLGRAGVNSANVATSTVNLNIPQRFGAGVYESNFVLRITDDGESEGPETFRIFVPDPPAGLNFQPATFTIVASDRSPAASIRVVRATGAEGGAAARFDIALSAAANRTSVVRFAFESGASTAGLSDFTADPGGGVSWNSADGTGQAVFASGVSSIPVNLNITNDNLPERRETIVMRLTSYIIGSDAHPFGIGRVQMAIAENDIYRARGDAASFPRTELQEGQEFTFRINLAGSPAYGRDLLGLGITGAAEWDVVRVTLGRTNGTTAPTTPITDATTLRRQDHCGSVSCQLAFRLGFGVTYADVTLRARDDIVDEMDETFRIQLVFASGLHSFDTTGYTMTIDENDHPLPDLRLGFRGEQTANEGDEVELRSEASIDEADTTLTTIWTQIQGPDVVLTPSSSTGAGGPGRELESLPTFTAPDVAVRSTLRFTSRATARKHRYTDASRQATLIVHVNDTEPPAADAGADIGLRRERTAVTLRGSGSDPDGDPGLTYRWAQIRPVPDGNGPNPEVVIGPHAGSTGTATATLPDIPAGTTESFTLRLTVADSAVAGRASLTDTDEVVLAVHDATPPTAVAGADQAVSTAGVVVTLDGSDSSDARGPGFIGTDRLLYQWRQVASDDPAAAVIGTVGAIANAAAATATFTAPTVAGHYYLRLTVTDTVTRQAAADVVRVTVQEEMTVRVSVDGDASTDEGGSASIVVRVSGGPPVSDITLGYRVTTATETVSGHAAAADYAVGGAGVTTNTVTVGGPLYRATTVTFAASDDDDLEGAESFRFVLGAVSGGSIGDSGVAISVAAASSAVAVQINDTDRVTRRVVRTDDDGFVEGGGGGAATALLDFIVEGAELPQALDSLALGYRVSGCMGGVFCTVLPDGESGAVLIVPSPGRLASTGTVTVMNGGLDNHLNEATRTITVTMEDVRGINESDFGGLASSGTVSWDVDLADDDDLVVGISPPATSARGSTATFVVTMSGASSGSRSAIEVPYSIGGEVEAADYTDETAPLNNGRLVFNAFETTGAITLRLAGDAATTDPDETLTVTLGAPVVGAGGGRVALSDLSEVTVTVFRAPRVYRVRANEADDDDAATPGVQAAEGTTATFTITLEGEAPTAPTTVTWGVGSDDLAASEYEVVRVNGADAGNATSGALVFTAADWETPRTVEVMVNDDGLNEGSEHLSLMLSNALGGGVSGTAIAVPSAEVIVPPSDAITYRVEGEAVVEPAGTAGGSAMAAFTVYLDGAPQGSAGAITASFTTGGTASPGSDYTALPLAVSIAAGATSAQVGVRILADELNEGGETITLALRDGAQVGAGGGVVTAASGAGRLGTVTIADNDDDTIRVSIRASRPRAIEGETVSFTMSIFDADRTAPMEVPFSVAGDAADFDIVSPPGLDAAATTGVLTIPLNRIGRIRLHITDDATPEDDETLRVVLGEPRTAGRAFASPDSATVVIAAGDQPVPAPALAIAADDFSGVFEEVGAYPLTADIMRDAADTPPSLLTWQWRQVVSTAADAAAVPAGDPSVYLGAITNAAGQSSMTGNVAANAEIAPLVYATGDYHFRLTVTATRADFLPAVVSDVVSIRFRDSDAPTTPEVSAAGADAAATDGDGHLLLSVRAGDRVVITTTATDLNPRGARIALLDDRYYEWRTDNSADFFSDALEPDVTPGRVTEFTVPAHPLIGGSTHYRHRVTAVDDGGERSAPRRVTIVHRDDAAPVASAGEDREAGADGPVMLDGGASHDARGPGNTGQLQYQWLQVSEDSPGAGVVSGGVTLRSADTAFAGFDASTRMETLYFRLTVTDTSTLRSAFDTVAITVLPRQTLGVSAPRAVTEGGVIRFTIAIGEGQPLSDGGVSVDWSIAGAGRNPAEPGDFDFDGDSVPDTVFPSGTAVIAAGQSFAIITAPTPDDLFLEGAETYRITLANPRGNPGIFVELGAAERSGEIHDNDLGNYSLTVNPTSVAEGGSVTFTLELAQALPVRLPVPFEVGGDRIEAGDFDIVQAPGVDAGAMAGVLTIPAAATRAQVVLDITDDAINEAAETLRVSFGEAGSGLGGDVVISGNDTIEVHIIGDEDALFSGQYIGPGNPPLPVVRRLPPFCSTTEFDLSGVRPGYELVEGTTATFRVVLGNFQGLQPGAGTYNGTFRSFPSAGDITVQWRVGVHIDDQQLSTPANPDFDFTADTPGNERGPRGRSHLAGRVTVPAGSTQAEIRFLVRDDGLNEKGLRAGELGRIYVDAAPGLGTGAGAGVVFIADGGNSCAAAIHVTARQLTVAGPPRIDETDSDISREYLITMTGSPFLRDTAVTWQLTTADPVERADAADFVVARTGTVRFGPGDPNGATRSFTVTVAGDNLNEATERSTVRVSVADPNADGGTRLLDPRTGLSGQGPGSVDDPRNIGPRFGSMSLVIPDDDPITATVTGGGNVDEGATATASVALSGGDLSRPGEVTYTLGADASGATVDAAAGVDYTDPAAGRVTIPVTGNRAAIRIPTTDDGLNEASEVFLATVGFRSAGASTTVNPVRRFTIRDDDDITVSFADAAVSIDEGRSARLAVGLSHPSAARLRVAYSVTAGGDNPPPFTDETGSPLVFEAGATTGEIVLTSVNTTDIDTGTGALTLAFDEAGIDIGAGGGVVGVSGAAVVTVAFREFDREFSVAADRAAAGEGDTAVFTVTLDGMAPTEPATVDWAIGGDVDARDYTEPAAASGQLSFSATGSEAINVVIAADGLNETTETLTLTLSGARGGGGQNSGITTATAMVVIAASDPATATVAADRATVAEGVTAVFTVALAGGVPTTGVAVPFTVTGDAADYDIVLPGGLSTQTTVGTLIIAAGSTGGQIGLAITDDDATEDEETLRVVIGAPRATGDIRLGADNSATVTIAASDQPLPLPAVMTAADDFAADNFQGAAYTLTGTAVRGAGDTAPPSTLTYQWLQVASTAVGAPAVPTTDTVVWLGALSGAAGTVSTDGVAAAVITPDVYATGDYHFRLTVVADKAGYKPSTASDVISVRFRDTDVPLQPVMAVTGDVTLIACAGAGACTLDVRQGEQVILTALSADFDEAELLEDRFFQWSTSGGSSSFFSDALEPDVTPGRVTTFTVPAHPVRGGSTEYRHRVVAMDSGGERSVPREVVIVHRDTGAPVAVAVAGMPLATSGETVVLDGLGSRNARGGVDGMTFRWRQVASTSDDAEVIIAGDPSAVELRNAGAATATFTAPLATPMLYFRLTVTDDITRMSDSAAVAVEVRPPPRILSVAAPDPAVAVEASTPAVVRLRLGGGVPHTAPVSVAWAVTGSAALGDDDAEAADFCLDDARTAAGALPRGTIELMPGDNDAEIALTFCFDNLAEPQEFYDVVFSMLTDGAGGAGTTEFSGGAAGATVSGRIAGSGSVPAVSLSGPAEAGVEGTSQTWLVSLDRAHTQAVEVLYRISSVTSVDVMVDELISVTLEIDGASADDFAQVQGAAVSALPLTGSVVIGAGSTRASIVLSYRNDDDDGPDAAAEPEEHFQVSLTGFDGDPGVLFAATLDTEGPVASRGSIVGTARAVAEVASRRASAAEGTDAVFTMTLDEAQSEATTVHWTLGGTAVRGVDYTGAGIAEGQLSTMTYRTVFATGSTRMDVTLDVADDLFNEEAETIVMSVVRGGVVRPGMAASATHRIEESDPIAVRLTAMDSVAPEGGTATFTILLETLPTRTVEVPWRVDAVGAVPAMADDFSDYSALPFAGTATFIAGGTTATTVSIAIASDRTAETAAQSFAFSVAAADVTGGYGVPSVANSPLNASIAADAPPPVVITAAQTPLSEDGGASPTFVITLRDNDGPLMSEREIRMTAALTGTADSGADYAGGETGAAIIAAGGSQTRVALRLLDDDLNESTETIVLSLSNPVPAGAVVLPPQPQTIEIADNDVITATVSGPSSPVLEGAAPTFTVSLSGGRVAAGTALTIPWRVGPTADTGDVDAGASDFVGGVFPSGAVSFGAGDTQRVTAPIRILNDGVRETTETFSLALEAAQGAAGVVVSEGVSSSAAIAASIESRYVFSVGAASGVAQEPVSGDTELNFIVSATATGAAHRSTLSVSYRLGGTASQGSDYRRADGISATTGTLMFNSGAATATVALSILSDEYAEATETIVVSLSAPDAGANPGNAELSLPLSSSVVLIAPRDDQRLEIGLAWLSGRLSESAGGVALQATQTSVSRAVFEATATVTYTLSGTADAGADYTPPSGYSNSSGTVVLRAGWPGGSVSSATLVLTDDSLNEDTETIIARISGVSVAGGYWTANRDDRTLELTDNDALTVSLADPVAPVLEGGSASFTVSLDTGDMPTAAVSVDYAIVPGGGVEAGDISGALTGSVSIAHDNAAAGAEIVVSIVDDRIPESTETLTVMLTGARSIGAVNIAQAQARAEIARSDIAQAVVAAAHAARSETEPVVFDLQFTDEDGAALSQSSVAGVTSATVAWSLRGATATTRDITSALSGTAMVPFNAATSVTVRMRADNLNEAAETVRLELTGIEVSGSEVDYLELSASSHTASVSVTDADAATVSVARAPQTGAVVNEGGTAEFVVTMDVPSQGDVEAPFTISGAGVDAMDYGLSGAQQVSLAAGTTMTTIALSIVADGVAESSETLTVTLQTPVAGVGAGAVSLGAASANVEISRNEAHTLFFSISAAGDVTEGDSAVFNVALTDDAGGGVARDATVDYSVTGGTAVAADYDGAASGTLTFTPDNWQTAQQISIAVRADNLNEAQETLTVALSSASGGDSQGAALRGGASAASVTIGASDPVTYSVTGPGAVSEGAGNAVFTAVLSGATSGSAAVIMAPFTIDTGTADASDVGTLPTSPVEFAAGATSTEIMVPITNDTVNEATETLTLTLGGTPTVGAGGGTVVRAAAAADYTATASIADNDALTIALTPASQTVAEGSSAGFVLTVGGGEPGGVVTLTYTITGNNADANAADISLASLSGETTIGAGETSGGFGFRVVFDNSAEDEETLTVELDEVAQAGHGSITVSGAAQVVIPANAADARTLTVTGPATITEGDAAVNGDYRIDLSGRRFSAATSVTWAITHGDTTAEDFAAVAGEVLFAADATSATFQISVAGDDLNEAAERFSVQAGVVNEIADGGTGFGDARSVTINDDDALTATIAADAANVVEGAMASFTVSLSGGEPTQNVQVSLTAGGTAEAGAIGAGGDYDPFQTALTMPPGTTETTVSRRIHDDDLNESQETLTLTLASVTHAVPSGEIGLGGARAATITIGASDEAEVSLARVSGGQTGEGDQARFRLTLNRASEGGVRVGWLAAVVSQTNTDASGDREQNTDGVSDFGGGAGDGDVFTAGTVSGTATIAANAASTIVSIDVRRDSREEDDETVSVRITGVSGGAGAGALGVAAMSTASFTIPGNRAATRLLSVRSDGAQVSEGGAAVFTVALSGEQPPAPGDPVTVQWQVEGAGANPVETTDYTTTAQTLSFASLGDEAQVRVGIANDTLNESTETLALTLMDASGGGNPPAAIITASASVEIAQSDPLSYRIEAGAPVSEDGSAMFTVRLSRASEGDVDVPLSVGTDPSHLASNEHAALAQNIRVSAGDVSALLSVALTDDMVNEAAEALVVVVGDTGAAGFAKGARAGVVLRDTDVTDQSARVAISDNDAAHYSVSVEDAVVQEGGSARLMVRLTSRDRPGETVQAGGDVTLRWSARIEAQRNFGATPVLPDIAGMSGATTEGSVVIAPGNSTASVVLPINADQVREDTETVIVTLAGTASVGTGGGAVSAGPGQQTQARITIPANEAAVHILSLTGPQRMAEGTTATYTITKSGRAYSAATTVMWAVEGASDVSATSGMAEFGASDGDGTTGTFMVGITDDTENEADETFRVVISVADSVGDGGTAFLPDSVSTTIEDNDPLTVTLSGGGEVAEGGEAQVQVSIGTDVTHTQPVEINYTVRAVGGDGGAADDLSGAAAGAVTIATAATGGVITVATASDDLNEGSERFEVSVADGDARSAGAVQVAGSPQTFTITDDDRTTATVVAPPRAFAEGRQPQFGVRLEGGLPTAPVSVQWSISTDTTTMAPFASAQDFVNADSLPITGTQALECSERACTVGVREIARDDDDVEETFTFGLLGASGGGGSGVGIGDPSSVAAVIGRTDTAPPALTRGLYVAGQRSIWLEADENLAILPLSQAAADDVVLRDEVSGLGGFTVSFRAGPSSGTSVVVTARYESPDTIVLELPRALTLEDGAGVGGEVDVSYRYPGSGDGIFDRAVEEGLAEEGAGRNQMMQTQATALRSRGGDADDDGDGLPDVIEAAAGSNPLRRAGLAELPAFEMARSGVAGSPALIAYSGIREFGARGHLGVSSVANTTQTAAVSVRAYYLSDTFGYDGGYAPGVVGYGCTGRFPPNYAALVRDGGCEIVDWGNVAASTEHRIGWLALGANGLWAVDTDTPSDLPEMVMERIPELNMVSERLFTTGTTVSVRALGDDGMVFETQTAVAGVFVITDLTGGASLWHPSAAAPMAGDYSLGLSTRTEVVAVAAETPGIPPVLGVPEVTSGGEVVNVLERGATYTLRIPVKSGGLTTTTERQITIPASASDTTTVMFEAPGIGGGVATASFTYRVEEADSVLSATGDADRDGIADAFDAFDEVAHLPVSVSGTAGASAWHHIRPVLNRHNLRTGDIAYRKAAQSALDGEVGYADYAASSEDNLPANLPVVYDFSIHNVDYAAVTTAGVTGGTAGVIIPLPVNLRGETLQLVKYDPASGATRAFDTGDGSRYGFAPLRDGVCPDDDGTTYRDGPGSGACLAVHIEDGGANDDDGVVNGIINDPLGVRRGTPGAARSHSGTFDPLALTVLLLLLALPARRAAVRRDTATHK